MSPESKLLPISIVHSSSINQLEIGSRGRPGVSGNVSCGTLVLG